MLRLLAIVLLTLPFSPNAPAQPASPTEIPVREVVLFTSGVGYFEHTGTVQGNAATELHFRTDQINDVLKSLVLQDLGGGRVGTVVYPAQAPLERTLSSFAVDLSHNPSMGALLNQMRGSRVRVRVAGAVVTGAILGAEQQRIQVDGAAVEGWVLNLLTGGALRSVRLANVERIELEDPALQAELGKALQALEQGRDQDKKPVQIHFRGQGTRRVRIGYVVETPVWKTSYRLLLPERGSTDGHLQGWAIVENQTESDWDGIDLALVSGRPISFIQDLYRPLYLDRPVVQPQLYENLRPQRYERGVAEDAATPADLAMDEVTVAGKSSMRAQAGAFAAAEEAAPAPFDPSASVASAATGAEMGDLFQYAVRDVTLPRQRSAMLPIVTEDVAVERVSIYNAAVLARHPLRGARLTNTTGLHLAPGPMTVLDDGAYAGDASLVALPPGQDALVSYAIDLDVLVTDGGGAQENTIQTGRIVDGVLRLTRRETVTQTYTLANEDERARLVVLEHPRRAGWELADTPPPMESTDALHRFRVAVAAGETVSFTVKEQDLREERIVLLHTQVNNLTAYARARELPEDVRRALERAAELHQALERVEQQIREHEQQVAGITREQDRIRQNMQTVDAASDYYRRLLEKLEAQEDEIESHQREIEKLRAEAEKRAEALRAYLADLDVG